MRKIILFLGVLLLTLGLFVGSASAVITTVSDAGKTFIEWKSGATVLFKIDDTDGVTIPGGVSASGNFTLTSPIVASNAVYGLINAGSAWATSGNLVGLRGKVNITAAGITGDATGVWAGLSITSASVQRFGLQVALNAEAYSNTVCLPNAVVYIQSLPSGATTDFSNVPYLVFSETRSASGTGSNILFEVGHSWANTIPVIGEDKLFYNDTLQIAVNEQAGVRTPFFIPLSTDSGTFTTEYPIDVTVTTGTGIDIGTATTGLSFTGTYSSHALDFSNTTQAAGEISLIRAGNYTTGQEMDAAGTAQYGMMRLYLSTDDDGSSYNRGVFVCLKTAGTKGIFPVSGLAEILTDTTGPTVAMAAQFIAGLHEAGSNLATAGAGISGMFGAWLKIYSESGSVAASGSTVAAVWVDNQMSGTVSGEEYGIFATTGGTRPDGFIGFETSSSGYDQFIYADTSFNAGAGTCFETEAVPTAATDARIKVWYDSKQYYIKLHR